MRVFILGGTGSIGTAILQELIARSHSVIALSRSEASDAKIEKLGATKCRGDLRKPANWIKIAIDCDAIVQVATTFGEDMGDVDKHVIDALIEASTRIAQKPRFLYTGGCWLYGETKNEVATEDRLFNPLPAFKWMVENGNRLLNCQTLSTAIIHPAMVYHAEGGVFELFLLAARENAPIEIWGNKKTRWPIIERSDLARAYCDLLVRPDLKGHFNAVSEEGVCVEAIARKFAAHYENKHKIIILNVDELVQEHGSWAKGPTLDQKMSSKKLRDATGWEPTITDYQSSEIFAQ